MIAEHAALEARHLRKTFGKHTAVRDLSLAVQPGEIFGFLGPNGAGKSTSIKMLLGLVAPTAGEALVLGRPANDVEVRRFVGFLPEDFRFYDWLTAEELLRFHGQLSGLTAARLRGRIPAVLEMVGLTAHATRRLRGFSKGMLQRIGLAQAIIHEPRVILLDEPTSGLDPMGRLMVRDVIRAQRDRGATVFLNSHLLSEIEVTCDRVAFLRDGEVVASHDLANPASHEVHVTIETGGVSPALLPEFATLAGAVQVAGPRVDFTLDARDRLPAIVRYLVTRDVDVFTVTARRPSLEELFVTIMGADSGQ